MNDARAGRPHARNQNHPRSSAAARGPTRRRSTHSEPPRRRRDAGGGVRMFPTPTAFDSFRTTAAPPRRWRRRSNPSDADGVRTLPTHAAPARRGDPERVPAAVRPSLRGAARAAAAAPLRVRDDAAPPPGRWAGGLRGGYDDPDDVVVRAVRPAGEARPLARPDARTHTYRRTAGAVARVSPPLRFRGAPSLRCRHVMLPGGIDRLSDPEFALRPGTRAPLAGTLMQACGGRRRRALASSSSSPRP